MRRRRMESRQTSARRRTKTECKRKPAMKKIAFYSILFSIVALAASPHSATQNRPHAKLPNIVFIMSDDHAAHAVSAYGSRLIKTPNIDRLAKEGKKLTGYTTDVLTDIAIDFVKNRPREKPFFLMYHHKAPHRNWQPDEKHRKQFENFVAPEPATFNDDYKGKSDAARQATMHIDQDLNDNDLKMKPPEGLSGQELKKWKYQRYMRDYLACVQSVDDNVGRFLDWLDKND